jgi:uncharacterized RDD family membrane protein YckC
MTDNTNLSPEYVGLARRLMAIVYDLFLLVALLFVATIIAMIVNQGTIESGQALHPLFSMYLLIISFGFYGWFWTHGGQTLGMKTWKMKLQQKNGDPVTWWLALIRFITAIISWSAAGTGFLWSLFHPQRRTWHDMASNCVLVDLRPDK